MKVAVVGCTHGRLETIYETIAHVEETQNTKIDLLLCCGDFQSLRNESDYAAFACPNKYKELGTFYKYYSGENKAPLLTIVIGGNHEASNFLQELPYGGWLAPNIYYLGYAGVVKYGGLRIAGISGICNMKYYHKGHFECPPYDHSTLRSVYYLRSIEIFRLLLMQQPVDIFMSHDWPSCIHNYGDIDELIRLKPYAADQIKTGSYGGAPLNDVLHGVEPRFWFAAHYHVKFPAIVQHKEKSTHFLSLDKCLPRRPFLQVIDIEAESEMTRDASEYKLEYDPEWLTILQKTNTLNTLTADHTRLPKAKQRDQYVADEETSQAIISDFGQSLEIPPNFAQTAPPHGSSDKSQPLYKNIQTVEFCSKLTVSNPHAFFNGDSDSDVQSQGNSEDDSDFEIAFE